MEENQENQIRLPLSTKAGVFVASAIPILGIDALAHLGVAGLAIGGIGAFALARQSPEIYAGLKDFGLWPRFPERPPGTRTFLDRLVGRYPTFEAVQAEAEPHTHTYEENQEVRASLVQLSAALALPLDDIAGKSLFIAGQRRSGKTTLGIRIAEEMGRHYIPLFFPDLMGDALSMVNVLPRGVVAGAPGSHDHATGAFWEASADEADILGYNILDEGLQVVLDVSSYESVNEAYQVVIGVIAGLFQWCKEHPDALVPCHIFLDEAQSLVPEHLNESILDRETARDLLAAYVQVSAMGGKYGLTPAILSQRFAQTNNKIMAQSEIRVIMRQTNDNDLRRCMEYVRKSVATEEAISAFQPGQGVWIGADGEQLVTQFMPRRSDASRSRTPSASAAQRYAQRPLSTHAGQASVPTSVSRKAVEPLEEDMEPLQPVRSVRPQNRPLSLLERGVAAYLDGATSQPKLAASLSISPWEARQLMPKIEAELKRQEEA